jgi:hypothetical protein
MYLHTWRADVSHEIVNNEQHSRYELEGDGGVAVAHYERLGDAVVFTHTLVPQKLQGGGLAGRLIAGALADVRRRGLKVIAECSFVAAYIERHPEERDLLA